VRSPIVHEDEAERTQQTEPSSQPATSADSAAEPVQQSSDGDAGGD